HHHLLHLTERVDGRVLWANLFLLFWLSLVPFIIRWLDEAGFAPLPTAGYGVVLGMAAVGYILTQTAIIACNGGADSALAKAVGRDIKGKASFLLYIVAVPTAFLQPWLAIALYVAVSAIWLVPDRRIEGRLDQTGSDRVQ
ncbi:MAG: TMEM175 family protein, partial [Bradyrhizobium sp.]